MKRQKLKFWLLFLAAGAIFAACEGPAGITGLNGADGAPGADGSDGTDGVDGNSTCLQCHTSTNMDNKETQYELSTHGMSGIMYNGDPVYIYAGRGDNRKSCAPCHTHEGFVEVQFTGRDTLTASLAAPTRIECKTCHADHLTFDQENDGVDYALRTTEAVTVPLLDGTTQVIDFNSNSNLCASCHKPRAINPILVADAEGNYTVPSVRFGPHHGPQASVLEGINGYEFPGISGLEPYPTSGDGAHRKAGCTACHMEEFSNQSGGHAFFPNKANCTTCHSVTDDFDYNGTKAEIEALFEELGALLLAKGMITETGATIEDAIYPIDDAGALFNYRTILEDRSMGIHNPEYVKALLENSITVIE